MIFFYYELFEPFLLFLKEQSTKKKIILPSFTDIHEAIKLQIDKKAQWK